MKIENNQILLEGKWMDLLYLYQFIRRLTTPFDKTSAFKLGIIDKDGNVLRKRKTLSTAEEKNAYTYFDTLIFNLKKLLGKLPFGKSALASFVAGLLLLREEKNYTFLVLQEQDETTLEKAFTKLYEEVSKSESYSEQVSTVRHMLSEQKIKEMMGVGAVPTTQEPVMTPKAVKAYHTSNATGAGIIRRKKPVLEQDKTPSDYEDAVRDRVESYGKYKVFTVDTNTFQNARVGKSRYDRYDKYIGKSPLKEHIREYAINNTNKPVILKDEKTGMLCFLKYGTEGRTSFNQYYK